MEGHIYSNWLKPTGITNNLQPTTYNFPVLNLIVSGGHTELVLMRDHGTYEIIGETQDDAVGEAFDKVARLLELGYPGGPIISKIAEQGDPTRYPLPSPMAKSKDFNFSYSGLKTAVLYLLRDLEKNVDEKNKADIAASFQEAATKVLIQKTIAAARKYEVKSIFLSGGVSANNLLRLKLETAAKKIGVKYSQPAFEYTGDNAAMIALAGWFQYVKNPPSLKLRRAGIDNFTWSSVQMDANISF